VSARVAVAEDNDDLRVLLELLIDNEPGLECVGSTNELHEVIPLVQAETADVLVLDVELRGKSSMQALDSIHADCPNVKIIFYTGHAHPEFAQRARAGGASALVLKSGDTQELLDAIHSAVGG